MDDKQFLDDFNMDAAPQAGAPPHDPRTGMFPDMTAEQYFADPIEEGSISNSGLKILDAETPLDFAFQHPRLNPEKLPEARASAAKRRGDIVHQLALGKGRGYEVGDFGDFKTKAAREWRDEVEATGKTPVLRHVYEPAEIMAEVLKERIDAALQGKPYITEVPIIWAENTPFGKVYARGMLDVWCEELATILDPKVTALLHDGRPGEYKINKHAVAMGWDRQAAWYKRGVERILPHLANKVRFGNLMVKPDEPFTSRLLWPSEVMRMTALHEMIPQVNRFAHCMATGNWPSYPDEGENFDLAPWEENRRLDAMEIRV